MSRTLLGTSLVFAAAVCASAHRAAAQSTGTIRGTVIEATTRRPLAGAQVYIPSSPYATATGEDGKFTLGNVPAGERMLGVRRIGFATSQQPVTVVAGQTVTVGVELAAQAISLSEIVVTGTAGATEMRKIGNSVASVDASAVLATAPVTSVEDLVKGRTAGVNTSVPSGTIGTGGKIRIRGLTSLQIAGDPVVYIDGVRVSGAPDDVNSNVYIGGQTVSRLQDLQPEEIDRIEIVKGAAASTLYGTQGSNGVIQIFTKKGRNGAPQWTFEAEQGINRIPTDRFPGRLWTQFVGPDGFRAHDPKEIVGNGHEARYSTSVSGGSNSATYFVSGSYKAEDASIAPSANHLQQVGTRANITVILGPKLSLTANSGFVYSKLRIPSNDNALDGLYSQVVAGLPYTATPDRPFGERFGSFRANQTLENWQTILRNTTGLTLDFLPRENFRHQANVGIDWYGDEFTQYFPYGYEGSGRKLGEKRNRNQTFRDITTDYKATLSNTLTQKLTSEFSVGVQGNFRNTVRLQGVGINFPAPDVRTVSAAANTTASEQRIQEINAGVFVQETAGLWDKLFLTGGVRVDGNSAFGNEFHYQAYPKASLAYTISQEKFWPSRFWPTMKLRFAYGASGLAPAQFAADRTYSPISAQNGQPAVTPNNIGNPNLGPEKSEEFEAGFDAGLWKDRLGLEVTAFAQRTTHALLRRPDPPSLGFLNAQLTNIGELRNRGLEMSLRALLYQGQRVEWSSNVNLTTQTNKITSMGGVAPFFINDARIVEGYPVQGIWRIPLASWDPVTRKHTAAADRVFAGQIDPKWYGSFSSEVRFGNLSLNGLADFQGGNKKVNFSRYWDTRVRSGDEYLRLVEKPTGKATAASDSLLDFVQVLGSTAYVEPADFLSLRELGVGYRIPDRLLRGLGLQNTTVRLAARNLKIWTRFSGVSPETNYRGGTSVGASSDFDTQPPARIFLLTFRTTR